MNKIAVVYWSGSGHTRAMAEAIAKGAEGALLTAGEFDAAQVADFDAFAFGCPAMGNETLEESEFEPMFDGCKAALQGKPVALFGSFSWGDGEWMRSWEEACASAGITLACDSVIARDDPDTDALTACEALGAALR